MEEVTIEQPATEPAGPSNPTNWGTKLAAGIAVGLLVGLVLAFTLESLDTSIGTIEDVEALLGVPVMGLIPDIGPGDLTIPGAPEGRQEALPYLITLQNPTSAIAESYRSLRTNLDFVALERQIKTLCIASASRSEGKSTTAINLAITMAQMGRRTLLVETDLRKPFLHFAFGLPKEPGLAEAILGNQPWTGVVRTVTDLMLGRLGLDQIVGAPNIDKLHVITSGTVPVNPTEFLNSQRMTELIAAFREQYDFVIFDCAPVLPVTDAAILSSKTDATLLVHRVGTIARAALRRAKTLLENVHGRVVGIVLTGLKAEISPDFAELEHHRYYYGSHETPPAVEPRRGPGERVARPGWLRSFFSSKTVLLLASAGAMAGAAAWYGLGILRAGEQPPSLIVDRMDTAPSTPANGPPPAVVTPTAPDGVTPDAPADAEAKAGSARRPDETGRPVGGFGLQVGAFREPARAQSLVASLRHRGLDAFSAPTEIPGKGRWVRVYVGPFPTAAGAEAARARLTGAPGGVTRPARFPYALVSEPLPSYDRASSAAARAGTLGYAPMVVEASGPTGVQQFRVRVDGFATPAESLMVAREFSGGPATFRAVVR